MDRVSENPNNHHPVAYRIEALKALVKLLLHEVEMLNEILPFVVEPPKDLPLDFNQKIQRYEADLISRALRTVNGNQRKAAQILGMKNTTLNSKIKRYEIDFWSVNESPRPRGAPDGTSPPSVDYGTRGGRNGSGR